MSRLLTLVAAMFVPLALAGQAAAGCYADYKARQNNPLRLHYGVIELPDTACADRGTAAREIDYRIGRDGWQLLNVMSIFDSDGLADRRSSAGDYFLKY
ncbi:hypothetical protein EV663_10488 [Rhodovulum bhavnagarense]|uniref:Uncharacterized protein n=1 Tax=Rhodovulum bhavnagarense TaxID=992286 RepID=A0A4R2RHM1_9RHOB|nr:hypothetical protein [Rhodovulum bhavnagarense]TCP61637.1 hypothetical protein EV663_10488 [Rhodovulum bhavnagarense]